LSRSSGEFDGFVAEVVEQKRCFLRLYSEFRTLGLPE
jgi:hypothetical protein